MATLNQSRALFFCTLLALAVSGIGCKSDDEIAVALQGDEKLTQGDHVPFLFSPVYPDPLEGIGIIEFQVGATMRLQLRVYTEDWQPVLDVFDETFVYGKHQCQLNVHSLGNGVYYCVMEGGGTTEIQPFRVVK